MATLKSVLANIEQFIGFPTSRTKQVARRLAEADIIPTGGPRRSPELGLIDFISVIAAASMDTGMADVMANHRRLHAMTPAGLPMTDDVPEPIQTTAALHLGMLAELALGDEEDQRIAASAQIEFVSAPVAEIIFRDRNGSAATFHEPSHRRGAWDAGHRRSVTIRGGALVSAARALFRK